MLLNQSISQYLLPSDVILYASNGVFVIYYSVDLPGERAKFKHDNEVSLMVHQAIVDRMQSKICDVLFVLLSMSPCLCQRIMGNFPRKSNKLDKSLVLFTYLSLVVTENGILNYQEIFLYKGQFACMGVF